MKYFTFFLAVLYCCLFNVSHVWKCKTSTTVHSCWIVFLGSRPSLILQSQSLPCSSPRDVPPDILLDSPERKQKKQKKMKLGKDEKDQNEKAAMYDIISSPSKDSTKLTLGIQWLMSQDSMASISWTEWVHNSTL